MGITIAFQQLMIITMGEIFHDNTCHKSQSPYGFLSWQLMVMTSMASQIPLGQTYLWLSAMGLGFSQNFYLIFLQFEFVFEKYLNILSI